MGGAPVRGNIIYVLTHYVALAALTTAARIRERTYRSYGRVLYISVQRLASSFRIGLIIRGNEFTQGVSEAYAITLLRCAEAVSFMWASTTINVSRVH